MEGVNSHSCAGSNWRGIPKFPLADQIKTKRMKEREMPTECEETERRELQN